uniref:NADH dehydrogenase subunit 4L n=1 Tax=Syndesmis kurakaikina TaxID=2711315 RepID=A0A7G5XUK6_9PLAT|nr:NADH dehydrogenase subunit 4L [Syndesmis kurakaikina]
MWSNIFISWLLVSVIISVIILKSFNFFWFLVYFEGLVLCLIVNVGTISWGGVILVFLSIFCVEAAIGISLLVNYSSNNCWGSSIFI